MCVCVLVKWCSIADRNWANRESSTYLPCGRLKDTINRSQSLNTPASDIAPSWARWKRWLMPGASVAFALYKSNKL